MMAGSRKENEAKWGQRGTVEKRKCYKPARVWKHNHLTDVPKLGFQGAGWREFSCNSALLREISHSSRDLSLSSESKLWSTERSQSGSVKDVSPASREQGNRLVGLGRQEVLTPGRLLSGVLEENQRSPKMSRDQALAQGGPLPPSLGRVWVAIYILEGQKLFLNCLV